MPRVPALAIAAVCGVVLTGGARAADMPGGWLPDFKQAQPFTQLVSGWYFRTDLGFRKYSIGSVDATPPELVTQHSINSVPTFGIGCGYKYEWFRFDVTADYGMLARFRGDTATTPSYYSAKIDALTVLANVYFDLGTWRGFTPYVGAGFGTSAIRTHEYSNITVVPADAVEPEMRWNISWAAMAGVSYQFASNLAVDVGYRYLSLGETASGTEPPGYAARTYFRDIKAQEIRVGLRWILD